MDDIQQGHPEDHGQGTDVHTPQMPGEWVESHNESDDGRYKEFWMSKDHGVKMGIVSTP